MLQHVTRMYVVSCNDSRGPQRVLYVYSAHPPPSTVERAVSKFQATIAYVWRLRCDNRLKEILWLLAQNAVSGNHITSPSWTCPCTRQPLAHTHRQHTFWDCPTAIAVREQLTRSLPGTSVTQAHVWLLEPPCELVTRSTWCIVCLAALTAMSFGHRVLWKQHLQAGPAPDDPVQHACKLSADHFWAQLQSYTFTAAATSEPTWLRGREAPFIGVGVDGALRVVLPPDP